jgi:hypothetical protein
VTLRTVATLLVLSVFATACANSASAEGDGWRGRGVYGGRDGSFHGRFHGRGFHGRGSMDMVLLWAVTETRAVTEVRAVTEPAMTQEKVIGTEFLPVTMSALSSACA